MGAALLSLMLTVTPARPWLDDARALVSKLQFVEALQRLEVARKAPSLEPETVREVEELRAYCLVALGRWAEAEEAWVVMLRADPLAAPSKNLSSPKVMRVVEQAKKRLFPKDYVELVSVEAPEGFVRVKVNDPWGLARDVVLVSRGRGGTWSESAMIRDAQTAELRLPQFPRRVEWYVEARGASGTVARIASADQPRASGTDEVTTALVPTATEPVVQQVVVAPKPALSTARLVVGVTALSLAALAVGAASWLVINGHQLRVAARDASKPPGDFASTALAAEREGTLRQSVGIGFFIGAGLAAIGGTVVLVW